MRDPDAPGLIGRLKRRADFLRAAKGKRWHAGAMTVQVSPVRVHAAEVADAETRASVRIGFTLTKKVGGAVMRNRARRRLREAVRLSPDLPVRPGHDYVIIGRIDALRLPFEALKRDLAQAVGRVHDNGRGAKRSKETRPERTRPKP